MKRFRQLFPWILLVAIISACNTNSGNTDKKTLPAATEFEPKIFSHSVIAAFPHDTSSYTQGLVIYKGQLYEGTGLEGSSKLMKVELKTGKVQQRIELPKNIFGEGITILRDTIYQLTWRNKVVFVYTLNNFKKVKEFSLPTEGWGITHDGTRLIVSDGSSNLYFYDPGTFRLLSKTTIMEGSNPTFNINELEFIDGFVYANQYQYPYILKIDPQAGNVVAKYDMSDLWNRVKAINPEADVPNGIAYDESTKKIYVTGKWWPEIYEIQLGQ